MASDGPAEPERALNAAPLASLACGLAVVTGGAGGIGLGLAVRAAELGLVPVILDLPGADFEAAEAALRAAGASEVMCIECDASDRGAVVAAAGEAREMFPGRPVSLLCGNAGFAGSDGPQTGGFGSVLDVGEAEWGRWHGVMVDGPIWLAQAWKDQIAAQAPARCALVNTASLAGLQPAGGAYGVVKHACVAVTESLHAEFRAREQDHVSCHVLCPALTKTNVFGESKDLLATLLKEKGMTTAFIADEAFRGVAAGRFYLWVDNPAGSGLSMNAEAALADRHARVMAGNPPKLGGVSEAFESELARTAAARMLEMMAEAAEAKL